MKDGQTVKLGSQSILIPKKINGLKLKIEQYRFNFYQWTVFSIGDKCFVSSHLTYDNESNDPKDDVFLASILFEIDENLLKNELIYFDDREIERFIDQAVPMGKPINNRRSLKMVRDK